jgi:pimeloyl-ACP methyl ester carboxylesterase
MRYVLIICITLIANLNGLSQQQQQGFIQIKDGKLYYEKKGIGPPLVFLHGIGLDHRMWEKQIERFSNSFTCINPDLRGFGKSSLPTTSPYSFHEDIKTLLDSLHLQEPVVLIALSMGGRGAINFALSYPAKTKALILADVVVDGYTFQDFKLEIFAAIAKQKGIDSANQSFFKPPYIFHHKKGYCKSQ